MITDWKGDLGREKSLWQVYRASKRLPKSDFNKFIYAISGMGIAGICTAWVARGQVEASYGTVLQVSEMAFELSAQILGFLIGGFAIFATVTDHQMMVRLAQTPMEKGGLSVFKNIFFNFMSVFLIFIATLTWAIIIQVATNVKVVDATRIFRTEFGEFLLVVLNSLAFAIMMGLMVFAIVRLKSFIWNIYQAFIIFLSVSHLMKKEEEVAKQDSAPPPA